MLSIELKHGQALKKCVILQRGVAVRKSDKEMLEDFQFFHELVLNEWAMKVSSIALRTLSDNKFNKVEIMLVTEDLLQLKKKLLEGIGRNTKALCKYPSLEIYRKLANLIVSRIVIFNKRRSNEAEKMKIEQYQNRARWEEGLLKEVSSSLQPLEL